MKIENTLYHNEKSVRVQPTLPAYVVSALKRWGDGNRISKGIVAYELILLESEEYEDSIDKIGSQIEREFTNLFDALPEDLERKIIIKTGLETLFDECEYANPDEQLARTNLHIPQNLRDQMEHTRGIGSLITDAVEHFSKVPWNSRTERLEILKQLVEYERDGKEPSHSFVNKIISGEFTDANELLFGDSEKWWHSPDLTIEDIAEGRGSSISQKKRGERIQALQTALDNRYENEEMPSPPKLVVRHAQDAFDISEPVAEDYANEIDYWFLYEEPHPRIPWFTDRIEEIYKEILKEAPSGHYRTKKLRKLSPANAAKLDESPVDRVVSEDWESSEELIKHLETLKDNSEGRRVQTNYQNEVHERVMEYIENEIERLENENR